MKSITTYQIGFAALAIGITILFRYLLTFFLNQQQYVLTWILAALYFVCMFSTGWYFGKKANQSLPIASLTFRFHLYTFIIFSFISLLWFKLNLAGVHENFESFKTGTFIWSILLLLHFGMYLLKGRNTIKGIAKTDIFE
jgi:hypothetical protein